MFGQGKSPFCHRPKMAYSVGIAAHILNCSSRWWVPCHQLLYSPPPSTHLTERWTSHSSTGCFLDKSLASARMCNPGSSSLYPLHYTDNATQTPTLSPFNSDLNLICVPAIWQTSVLPSGKVMSVSIWYVIVLRNLRNMLMENKIVNPVLHKNDTIWNISKWRSKND